MAPVAVEFLKMAASAPSQAAVSKALTRLFAHGGGGRLQPRRSLGTGRCLATPARPSRKTRERVEIPGLDTVTYGARMHYVPGLSKPVSPPWTRDYKDPSHYRSPAEEDMELRKEAPCYIFNQRTSALEGVPQALWLTKSQLVPGLPPKVLALAEGPSSQIPDQDLDERVKDAVKHARFWDTTEDRPGKGQYSSTLLSNLLHLCASLSSSPSARSRRILAEKSSVAASWRRGEDLFQVRGQMGLLSRSMEPLQQVADAQEVAQTTNHVLETFYPVSPAIQLQKVHVYKEDVNSTGFHGDHAYPYTHTLYFLDGVDSRCKLRPEQLRAKMIMFTFGNALAHARAMYGEQGVLERPVTLQAVATNGRVFHFLVFQLNTTDLTGDDGIKNQVWLDGDMELYDFAKVRPLIKRKQVKVPAGLAGYKPETFKKFLSLYLHGAA